MEEERGSKFIFLRYGQSELDLECLYIYTESTNVHGIIWIIAVLDWKGGGGIS